MKILWKTLLISSAAVGGSFLFTPFSNYPNHTNLLKTHTKTLNTATPNSFHLPTLWDQSTVIDYWQQIANDANPNPYYKDGSGTYTSVYHNKIKNTTGYGLSGADYWKNLAPSYNGTEHDTPGVRDFFQLQQIGYDPQTQCLYCSVGLNTELIFYCLNYWNFVTWNTKPDAATTTTMPLYPNGQSPNLYDFFGNDFGNDYTKQVDLRTNYFLRNYTNHTSDFVEGGRSTWINKNDISNKNLYDARMTQIGTLLQSYLELDFNFSNIIIDGYAQRPLDATNYYPLKNCMNIYARNTHEFPTDDLIKYWLGVNKDAPPGIAKDYLFNIHPNGWTSLKDKFSWVDTNTCCYILSELPQLRYSFWYTFIQNPQSTDAPIWYSGSSIFYTDFGDTNSASPRWKLLSSPTDPQTDNTQPFVAKTASTQSDNFYYSLSDILNGQVKIYFPYGISQDILNDGTLKLSFAFNSAAIPSAQTTEMSAIAGSGTTDVDANIKSNTNLDLSINKNPFLSVSQSVITANTGPITIDTYNYTIPNDAVTEKSSENFYSGSAKLKDSIKGHATKDGQGNPNISADDAIKYIYPNGFPNNFAEQDLFYLFKNIFDTDFDYKALFAQNGEDWDDPLIFTNDIKNQIKTCMSTISQGFFPFLINDAIKNRDDPSNMIVQPDQFNWSLNTFNNWSQWSWLVPSTPDSTHTGYEIFLLHNQDGSDRYKDSQDPELKFEYSKPEVNDFKGTITLNILSYKLVDDPSNPGHQTKQYSDKPYATWSTPDGTFKPTGKNPDTKKPNYLLIILGCVLAAILLAGLIWLIIYIRKGKRKTNTHWRVKKRRKLGDYDDD